MTKTWAPEAGDAVSAVLWTVVVAIRSIFDGGDCDTVNQESHFPRRMAVTTYGILKGSNERKRFGTSFYLIHCSGGGVLHDKGQRTEIHPLAYATAKQRLPIPLIQVLSLDLSLQD